MDRLDADPSAQPSHVVAFGPQLHAQGVLSGSPEADRCIAYLVKYLAKSIDTCHDTQTPAQEEHLTRLWRALRFEPCSPTCANWLRYGIQPKNPRAGLRPGCCRGKTHRRETLGFGGRRVLVSRKWSGKTLATTGPTVATGSATCLVCPMTPPAPATCGSRRRPATPTSFPARTGSCSPSPTAPAGETNWRRHKTPPGATATKLFRQLAHLATRERRLECLSPTTLPHLRPPRTTRRTVVAWLAVKGERSESRSDTQCP